MSLYRYSKPRQAKIDVQLQILRLLQFLGISGKLYFLFLHCLRCWAEHKSY